MHPHPAMTLKTVDELQQEVALIEQSLSEAVKLANQLPHRASIVATATTMNVLGQMTPAQLHTAQAALTEAESAVIRRQALEQSLESTKACLEHAKGQARRAKCQAIAAEYQTLYQTYREQCKQVEATFLELYRISALHQGLTQRALMEDSQHDLNLPPLRNQHASGAFSSAQGLLMTKGLRHG
jgi:hypothetical protein